MLISSRILNFVKNAAPTIFTRGNRGGFAAAMNEALDKHDAMEEQRKVQRETAIETVKQTKAMKRNLKKRKWVDWDAQDEKAKALAEAKRAAFDPAERVKRKKCVLLLSYCGARYFGMQRNPGMETIEEELFKALMKHKWITEDGFEQAQNACFQRAARTDKGVSAARQVCSIKLPDDLDLKALNGDLPADIRVFGTQRVTKGFNAKDQCNARTYTYTLPTIAFAECTAADGSIMEQQWTELQQTYDTFRLSETQLQKLRDTLELYEGTKNYHNFTSRKNFLDPSAKRFIMSFSVSGPFNSPQGIEFVCLRVKGQSFMLHQIRKMVGLTIAIVRGNTTTQTLERALTEERLDLPMAPGLGLVLDTVHYERYNERYGTDGIHAPLTWEAQAAEIEAFSEEHINANIYATEHTERPMLAWLETLAFHSYDTRRDEPPMAVASDKKRQDDDDDE